MKTTKLLSLACTMFLVLGTMASPVKASDYEEILSEDEIAELIKTDSDFAERVNEKESLGFELREVKVIYPEITAYNTVPEKIVESEFYNVKRGEEHYSSLANSSASLKNCIIMGVDFLVGKLVDLKFSPGEFFSRVLSVDDWKYLYSDGRIEYVADITTHERVVYHKTYDVLGDWSVRYSAEWEHIELTMIEMFHDSKNNMRQESKTTRFDFYSDNYRNKVKLFELARTVPYYTIEYANVPDLIRL